MKCLFVLGYCWHWRDMGDKQTRVNKQEGISAFHLSGFFACIPQMALCKLRCFLFAEAT